MPVSRNRNKKNKKYINRLPSFADLSRMKGLDNCRNCNGLRDEFSLDELPDEEQEHWKEPEIKDSIESFLFCPTCEEYSAIFGVEEF
jgi:hypothetical protein